MSGPPPASWQRSGKTPWALIAFGGATAVAGPTVLVIFLLRPDIGSRLLLVIGVLVFLVAFAVIVTLNPDYFYRRFGILLVAMSSSFVATRLIGLPSSTCDSLVGQVLTLLFGCPDQGHFTFFPIGFFDVVAAAIFLVGGLYLFHIDFDHQGRLLSQPITFPDPEVQETQKIRSGGQIREARIPGYEGLEDQDEL